MKQQQAQQTRLKATSPLTKGTFAVLFRPYGVRTGKPGCESICFLDNGELARQIATALTQAYPEAKGSFIVAIWNR